MSGIVARLCEEVPGPNGTVVLKPITTARLVTMAQAATVLGVSHATVYRWVNSGVLPASKFSDGTIRMKADDLIAFMRGAEVKKQGGAG